MNKRNLSLIVPALLFGSMLFFMQNSQIEGDNGFVAAPWKFDEKKVVITQSRPRYISAVDLNDRRESVREAYLHAYRSYKKHAWGHDELAPKTQDKMDWLGMALTIVDSLDTMYLMGHMDEYKESREWIENNLNFAEIKLSISVFETTIRVVGGLLSTYELTGDELYLRKAKELGDLLMPAFDSPSGFPYTAITLNNGKGSNGFLNKASLLADVGTTQMEFSTLSKLTGINEYAEKSLKIFDMLDKMEKPDGLYPVYIDVNSGKFQSQRDWLPSKWDELWGTENWRVKLGGAGDSYYEYLLKLWILTGKTDDQYKRMYNEAMDAVISQLVKVSQPSGFVFVAEKDNGKTVNTMEHLACFLGALFALGAHHNATSEPEKHMQLGIEITKTCHDFYARQPTGLAPDTLNFQAEGDYNSEISTYLLRPETVESYYVLYWLTGDPIYQEWGWEAFQAIEKHCRTKNGYSGIVDVTATHDVDTDNIQQSFFLAETLKYLYLLFSPHDTISLDDWVFNTEAHPLKVW